MAEFKSQFTVSTKIGKAPLSVNFTNTSTGAFTSCLWDFGDGSNSSEIHPTHQFVNDGSYSVKLTIYTTESDLNSISSQTVSVFPDNQIDSAASTEQSTLSVLKRFEPGQVAVIQEILTGSTYIANTYFSSSNNDPHFGGGNAIGSTGCFIIEIDNSELTGATGVFTVNSTAVNETGQSDELYNWMTGNTIDYDRCLIGFVLQSTGMTTTQAGTGSGNLDMQALWDHADYSSPRPQVVWHKLSDITNTTGTDATSEWSFTAERDLPWRGETGIGLVWLVLNSNSTEGTSYAGNYFSNPAITSPKLYFGIDKLNQQWFDGGVYNVNESAKGVLQKMGETDFDNSFGIQKAVIYPDSTEISSANALAPKSNELFIPWLQTSAEAGWGLALFDAYGGTEIEPESGLRFGYMRAGLDESATIYGRIFYDLKAIVIDDLDANIALQNNSNRCYMLEPLAISKTSDSLGWGVSGITYYITYAPQFPNHGAVTATDTFGLGGVGVFPCGKIAKHTCTIDGEQISIQSPISNKIVAAADSAVLDGDGGWIPLSSNQVSVFVATGTTTEITSSSWKQCVTEYTGDLKTGFVLSKSWHDIGDMVKTAWNIAGPLFNLGKAAFTPGDEEIALVYMGGNLETISYKISATCVAKNSEFNSSQNKTHTIGSTYITEVGIYNENNDLLMVGKLNRPIEKDESKYVVIKMELDL